MMDSIKVGSFITRKRKEAGLTQQQLADKLNISFQAVSKWETGNAYPNVEILYDLAMALRVTTDELLTGNEKSEDGLSYSKAGVDIAYTDTIKREMAKHLETEDKRVLNRMGAFASLYDIHFPMMKEPVLVLKAEEPGSKQKLAMEYGYTESIVEKKDVIDGSAIQNNDVVLAVASNGLHTNGYSLVRMLMDRAPQTKLGKIFSTVWRTLPAVG